MQDNIFWIHAFNEQYWVVHLEQHEEPLQPFHWVHWAAGWLSADLLAQPNGGALLCGNPPDVFQGLSHGGAEWPPSWNRLCPGDDPHLPHPCHGHPGGAQNQEWRQELLIGLKKGCSPTMSYHNLPALPKFWGLSLEVVLSDYCTGLSDDSWQFHTAPSSVHCWLYHRWLSTHLNHFKHGCTDSWCMLNRRIICRILYWKGVRLYMHCCSTWVFVRFWEWQYSSVRFLYIPSPTPVLLL